MPLQTLVFGAIGALVETSDLQRQSFNQAFSAHDLDWEWSEETYKRLLETNGGKNRIKHFARENNINLSEERVADIHQSKTDIYEALIKDGGLSARHGIADLIKSAKQNGVRVGMASTTSPQNIEAIFKAAQDLDRGDFDFVLSGEDAKAVKPAPDIYLRAIECAPSNPDSILVIEDTPVSAQSAKTANLKVVIYPGEMIKHQDFSVADAVISGENMNLDTLVVLLN